MKAISSSDLDKLNQFKARRLAQREADRVKLSKEFPLLFTSNNQIKDSTTQRRLQYMEKFSSTKPTLLSSGVKRKPANLSNNIQKIDDKENENNSNIIEGNISNSSSKKAKIEEPPPIVLETNQGKNYKKNQNRKNKKKFSNSKLEVEVSQPILEEEVSTNLVVNGSEEIVSTIENNPITMQEEEAVAIEREIVEEQIQDCLDYLLYETKEVDVVTHSRLSFSHSLSVSDIRRLSRSRSRSIGGISHGPSLAVEQQDQPDSPSLCTDMQDAYREESLTCSVGEMDVLNALRSYIQMSTNNPTLPTVSEERDQSKETEQEQQQEEETDDKFPPHSFMTSRDSIIGSPMAGGKVEQRPMLADGNRNLISSRPMNELLQTSLLAGLVSVSMDSRVVQDGQMKYVLHVQIVDMQGEVSMRMLSIKSFSDFRSLHQAVTMACQTLRQKLGNDNKDEEEEEESIPPLPSRHILALSMGIPLSASDESSESYMDCRQTYLRNWLSTLLLKQKTDDESVSKLWTDILVRFLACQ